jgi:hypothetical protein
VWLGSFALAIVERHGPSVVTFIAALIVWPSISGAVVCLLAPSDKDVALVAAE